MCEVLEASLSEDAIVGDSAPLSVVAVGVRASLVVVLTVGGRMATHPVMLYRPSSSTVQRCAYALTSLSCSCGSLSRSIR